ncbi:UNVERIFIED_ORG: hypothetical protein JN05_02894 [Zoogloea ramigera]|uniref:Secretion system X translation initiation factor n=1 Tax=Duganella zoogloeoides TaxID=75659 RepID=A0ABZ0XUY5_9BURK|nr:hypothetical protein [Duganella zoogloeoides]WQH03228.1 hypothetical protein SR858_19540 [Duganella zoogloeoides]
MKPYHIVMGLALAGAAALVLFGDRTPAGEIVEPVVRRGAPAIAVSDRVRDRAGAGARPDVAIARLVPRAQLVGAAGDATFGAGEGVFLGQNWNPPQQQQQPTAAERAAANAPAPPPMAPPVPFNYFGKAVQDGAWEVYLARGDKTYIARNHSVIEGAWRVDRIAPPLLTVTYLPLNQVQQINIGAID